MNKLIILGIVGIMGAAVVKNETGLPIGKMTAHVIDEKNQPLEGALVSFAFAKGKPRWGGGDVETKQGLTDAKGNFSASGPAEAGLGPVITKDGYYWGSCGINFTKIIADHWQPWNPTLTVQLKKKVNPIPMYAKEVRGKLPAFNTPVGYDLEVGDWVAPYGKGKISDFIFVYSGDYIDGGNYNMKFNLRFSSQLDGIQSWETKTNSDVGSSQLKSDRIAPETGYTEVISKTMTCSSNGEIKDDNNEKINYYFRVRSTGESGTNPKNGLYGKIYGDINVGLDPHGNICGIVFTYCLNPTQGDRNMEFDPKQNLIKDLDSLDKPQNP